MQWFAERAATELHGLDAEAIAHRDALVEKVGVFAPLREAIAAVDPTETGEVTSAVCVWVTPTERNLGFLECVQPEDAEDIANMLRFMADQVSAGRQ
jgi:hypothetical protein